MDFLFSHDDDCAILQVRSVGLTPILLHARKELEGIPRAQEALCRGSISDAYRSTKTRLACHASSAVGLMVATYCYLDHGLNGRSCKHKSHLTETSVCLWDTAGDQVSATCLWARTPACSLSWVSKNRRISFEGIVHQWADANNKKPKTSQLVSSPSLMEHACICLSGSSHIKSITAPHSSPIRSASSWDPASSRPCTR